VDEIVLGHFNAGFPRQDFNRVPGVAGLARPALKRATASKKCLRHGFGGRSIWVIRAMRHARRASCWRSGVDDDDDAGPGDRPEPSEASYVRDEADIDGGFAGIFGQIAGLYFQNMATSPTAWR